MAIRTYLRCSSDSQDLDSQQHAIARWLSAYGNDEPVIPYNEEGISGDAQHRPEYDRLRDEVCKGDTVLVFAIDRLSREGIVPTLTTIKEFIRQEVRLVSLSEPWLDTTNPCWDLIVSVLAWVAEQEKRKIKERQRAGIAAAKAKGKRWGGRKAGSNTKRTPKTDQQIRELRDNGHTITSIAELTKLCRPTIRAALKD